MRSAGPLLTHEQWTEVCDALLRLFESSTPHALIDSKPVLLFNLGLAPAPPSPPPVPRAIRAASGGAQPEFDSLHQQLGQHISEAARGDGGAADAGDASGSAGAAAAFVAPRGWVMGQQVVTPYGAGRVLDMRGDGMAVVQLEYGIAYVPTEDAADSASASVVRTDGADVDPRRAALPPIGPGQASRTRQRPAPGVSAIPFEPNAVVTKCVIQLGLIRCTGIIINEFLSCLDETHVRALAAALKGSSTFARKFNADRQLREALLTAGECTCCVEACRRHVSPLLLSPQASRQPWTSCRAC